ncbi:MAG: phosphoribosylformylglycinamidine synthase I [Elusimicrobia bacterium]|nr:phosphoribosylformylglycinamidine synthase I [Elusimicrobiota bacterium]
MSVKALIVKAPGTNCDQEAKWGLELAGAKPEIRYLKELQERPQILFDYGLLFVPGGFSYGDYLGSGKLFALFLESALGQNLRRFAEKGRPVLGVCNGFQVLTKMGLLPWGETPCVSLTYNASNRFECRWVGLELENNSVFAKKLPADKRRLLAQFELPIAHGEGRFVAATPETLDRLGREGHVFLRYSKENPNGSENAIAGITNREGNVIGLMPHPERFVISDQHYDSSGSQAGKPWGLEFLKAAVRLSN